MNETQCWGCGLGMLCATHKLPRYTFYVKRRMHTLEVVRVTDTTAFLAKSPRMVRHEMSWEEQMVYERMWERMVDVSVAGARVSARCPKLNCPGGRRIDGKPEAARFFQPWETQR